MDKHIQPHAYAGTEMFMQVFTPQDQNFRLEFLVRNNKPKRLSEKEKTEISELLSDIPTVTCDEANGDYSILVKNNRTIVRMFSYFNGCFRETVLKHSNKTIPEYPIVKQKLLEAGYGTTEFEEAKPKI